LFTGLGAPPLTAPYDGPFRVVERGGKVFRIQMGDSVVEVICVDRLQSYRGTADPEEAVPPKRGRSPGTGGSGQPALKEQAAGGACVAERKIRQRLHKIRNCIYCYYSV
jgi:hypothetical protein